MMLVKVICGVFLTATLVQGLRSSHGEGGHGEGGRRDNGSRNGSGNGTDSRCRHNQHACAASSQCIPQSWVCDDYRDCPHGDDERNCTHSCRENQHSCADSSECIPEHWVCDNYADCPNGDDELDCSHNNGTDNSTESCTEDQYACANSTACIPESWRCDQYEDCANGDDEWECDDSSNSTTTESVSDGQFTEVYTSVTTESASDDQWSDDYSEFVSDWQGPSSSSPEAGACPERGWHACPSNRSVCVWWEQICDGVVDCPDAEDEMNNHCKGGDKDSISFEFGGLEFQIKEGDRVNQHKLAGAMEFLWTLMGNVACLVWDHCHEY